MEILEYQESFGPYRFQDGFEKELAGKSVDEQIRLFALTEESWMRSEEYTQLEEEINKFPYCREKVCPIPTYWKAIVKEGIVVGFHIPYSDSKIHPLLPYCGYVYDSSSDNNGSGYKERDWYRYLVCLPTDHTLW